MDRLDYFFRQLVTESDLDLGFDQVQARIESETHETDFDGMITGGDASESSPVALTVEISGPAFGYGKDGKRLSWLDDETVDVSQDDFALPTSVGGSGNSKILSVFVEFDEDLQDLQLDGLGQPVFFKRLASKRLFVVQSAEAVNPTPPPLRPDALLLVDITRTFGQTTITTSDFDVTRREDFFRRIGTNNSIVRGTIRDVAFDLLDLHNELIDDLAAVLPPSGASLIGVQAHSSTPTGGSPIEWTGTDLQTVLNGLSNDLTNFGASTSGASRVGLEAFGIIASENVQSALEELVGDLENQGVSPGAAEVGVLNHSVTPTGGVAFSFADGTVQATLQSLIDSLTATAGADRVGTTAKTGAIVALPGPLTLPVDAVEGQLKTLLDYLETLKNTPFTASVVSYIPHDYIVSTNVQAAIDELIDDLQSQVGGVGAGSFEIGYKGIVPSPAPDSANAPSFTFALGSVEATLDKIGQELAKRAALFGGQTFNAANPVSFGDSNFRMDFATVNIPTIQFDTFAFVLHNRTNGRYIFNRAGDLLHILGGGIETLGVNVGFFGGAPVSGQIQVGTIGAGLTVNVNGIRPDVDNTKTIGTGATNKFLAMAAQSIYGTGNAQTPINQADLSIRNAQNAIVAKAVVSAAGTLAAPNWNIASVSHPSTGIYNLLLDQPIHINAAVVATVRFQSGMTNTDVISGGNNIIVETRSASGSLADRTFHVIAIGRPSIILP